MRTLPPPAGTIIVWTYDDRGKVRREPLEFANILFDEIRNVHGFLEMEENDPDPQVFHVPNVAYYTVHHVV
jgi:hypothetical protein